MLNAVSEIQFAIERVDRLLQFILALAALQDSFQDRELGPIHLIKYTYLGDLAFAERHEGASFTGAPWRFHHFGPWDAGVLERIEPAVAAIHAQRRQIPSSRYDKDFVRYGVHEDARHLVESLEEELPWEVTRQVRWALHEYGADTARLLHFVYTTPPMVRAAPGDPLDFQLAVRPLARPPALESDETEASTRRPRRQRDALRQLRERVQARLAERLSEHATPATAPAPRYDEVFAEGVQWLDSLAGEPVPTTDGELRVADDVWKSPARSDSDVP